MAIVFVLVTILISIAVLYLILCALSECIDVIKKIKKQ